MAKPSCVAPIQNGPHRGQSATGTPSGYRRHRRLGEIPCLLCWDAMRQYQKEWKSANASLVARWNREFYQRNRAHRLAADRERTQRNPDRRRRYDRQYYLANRERIAAYKAEWKRQNPDKVLASKNRRRAKAAGTRSIPFTVEQLEQRMAYFGNRCWLCGSQADTVDHVFPLALSGWHCLSNLRPACRPCNARKGTRPPDHLRILPAPRNR